MNNDTKNSATHAYLLKYDTAYGLLCKVFGEFFLQMRRSHSLINDRQVDEVWQKDWDKLKGPVLNHIREALEAYLKIGSEHIPPYPKTRPRPANHPPDKGGENE